MPLQLLQTVHGIGTLHFVQCAFTASLVFHSFESLTFGATRDIISQYSFTWTLVSLNKGGNEGEPLVTSSSNLLMGGAALAC